MKAAGEQFVADGAVGDLPAQPVDDACDDRRVVERELGGMVGGDELEGVVVGGFERAVEAL